MDTMEVYAYFYRSTFYCRDCLCELLGLSEMTEKDKNDNIDAMIYHGQVGTINDTTVQYEQWSGELIPLEGVFCVDCDSELYPAMEVE